MHRRAQQREIQLGRKSQFRRESRRSAAAWAHGGCVPRYARAAGRRGEPPSMDTLANYPQDTLCIDALNSVRSNWDDRANFAAKVAEAQRRGLTIDACREALGLPAIVRSPPPQASPSYAEFGPVDLGTLSEKPRLIATYGDWSVYCSKAKSSKVCYSLATPKMRTPDLPNRGQSYLFVSNRPGEGVANEVSFVMGAALSPRGAPRVEIGRSPASRWSLRNRISG